MRIRTKMVYFLYILILPALPMPTSNMGYISGMVTALFVSVGLLMFARNGFSLKKDSYLIGMILFLLLLVLSEFLQGIVNGDSKSYLYGVGRILSVGIFVTTYILLDNNSIKELDILKPLIISACVVAILLIMQSLSIYSIGNETLRGRTYFGISLPVRKATGFEMSDGRLGTILVPALLFAGYFFKNREANMGMYQAGFLVIITAIVFSQSRSMYLALIISMLVYLVVVVEKKWVTIVLTSMCFMVVIIFSTGISDIAIKGFVSEGVLARNVDNRFEALSVPLSALRQNVIFGIGHENMLYDSGGKEVVIHNQYLAQFGATGLLGGASLVTVYLIWLITIIKREAGNGKFAHKNKRIKAIFAAIFAAVLVEMSFYRGFYNEYVMVYMALTLIILKKDRIAKIE